MERMIYSLDEMHAIQLNMLRKLIEICKEHHFTYFLAFGSLLGAARDHKIIPWDDSIDVVMPAADYERLVRLPQAAWGEGLFLQTCDTDPQYPKCYAKLRDSRTTLIKAEYANLDINQGIYINIMPIIPLSDDLREQRKQLRSASLYKAVTEGKPVTTAGQWLRMYSAFLLRTSGEARRKKIRERLKRKVYACAGERTRACIVLAGHVSLSLVLASEIFESPVDWEFEGMTVNIPAGWLMWLTLRYGDYTAAPISELREDKTSPFVTLNTQRPYTEYRGKTYCV